MHTKNSPHFIYRHCCEHAKIDSPKTAEISPNRGNLGTMRLLEKLLEQTNKKHLPFATSKNEKSSNNKTLFRRLDC